MALQNLAQNEAYFAPARVLEPVERKALQSIADSSDAVSGIAVNVTEGPIGFGVTATLPELEEEDIILQSEPGNVLCISAQRTVRRTVHKQSRNRTFTSTEESSEFLQRSLKLPDSADLSRINTSYSDGVLTLLIAKHEGSTGQVDSGPVVLMD